MLWLQLQDLSALQAVSSRSDPRYITLEGGKGFKLETWSLGMLATCKALEVYEEPNCNQTFNPVVFHQASKILGIKSSKKT